MQCAVCGFGLAQGESGYFSRGPYTRPPLTRSTVVQSSLLPPSPDLAPGDSVGYNWMAPMQQSMDSLSFTIGAGSTVPEPQQSSLLFSLARTKRPAFKTLKPPGETFAKGALQPTTSAGTQQPTDLKAGQQQDVMRLKRRFHTDRRATSTFFGQMQTRKKLAQEVRENWPSLPACKGW